VALIDRPSQTQFANQCFAPTAATTSVATPEKGCAIQMASPSGHECQNVLVRERAQRGNDGFAWCAERGGDVVSRRRPGHVTERGINGRADRPLKVVHASPRTCAVGHGTLRHGEHGNDAIGVAEVEEHPL
jgi:hypothetical protein